MLSIKLQSDNIKPYFTTIVVVQQDQLHLVTDLIHSNTEWQSKDAFYISCCNLGPSFVSLQRTSKALFTISGRWDLPLWLSGTYSWWFHLTNNGAHCAAGNTAHISASTQFDCRPYMHRCVSFLIKSNQLNCTQVHINQVLKNAEGQSKQDTIWSAVEKKYSLF